MAAAEASTTAPIADAATAPAAAAATTTPIVDTAAAVAASTTAPIAAAAASTTSPISTMAASTTSPILTAAAVFAETLDDDDNSRFSDNSFIEMIHPEELAFSEGDNVRVLVGNTLWEAVILSTNNNYAYVKWNSGAKETVGVEQIQPMFDDGKRVRNKPDYYSDMSYSGKKRK